MSTSQVLVSSTANFIEAAQRHPDTQQRLAAAEKALAAADKLQLTQAQLDWCSTELGHGLTAAVSAQESVAEVLAAYPTVSAIARFNGAEHSRNKTTLKAVLADQLGCKNKDAISAVTELAPAEVLLVAVAPALPEQPHLMLEPDTGKLYLILPAIMPSDDENIEWLIDAGFDSFRIPASLDEDGRPQSQRVSIVQPTARITVTNSATGEKLRLPGIDSSFPAVVV